MSLENEIKKLTAAVEALTAKMSAETPTPVAPEQPTAPEQPAAPTAPTAPTAPVAPAAPAAPAAPTAPAAPAATGIPFTDSAGLTQYVMGKYQQLGPEKGARIQAVLTGLGYHNINDVKPEHFTEFFNGVEAIV